VVASILGGTIVGERATLVRSLSLLVHVNLTFVLSALGAELVSMGAFARAQRQLLRSGGARVNLAAALAVTYAANAIAVTIPLAGAAASVAFVLGQYRRRGVDPVLVSWSLVVNGLASSFTFAVLLAAGALATGSMTPAALGLLGATLSLVPLVAILAARRSERVHRLLHALLASIVSRLGRALHRPLGDVTGAFDTVLARLSRITVSRRRYAQVFVLSLVNWVASFFCLASAILAVGAKVPWSKLALAYGAGVGAGMVPLTPGGLGVVELTLSAALVVAGLTATRALAAVLLFRLLSFWLVMVIGWLVTLALNREPIARH
jgi:uncharacterized protein (TIRG00374 family)